MQEIQITTSEILKDTVQCYIGAFAINAREKANIGFIKHLKIMKNPPMLTAQHPQMFNLATDCFTQGVKRNATAGRSFQLL